MLAVRITSMFIRMARRGCINTGSGTDVL